MARGGEHGRGQKQWTHAPDVTFSWMPRPLVVSLGPLLVGCSKTDGLALAVEAVRTALRAEGVGSSLVVTGD